jgi:hypothetical protein
MKVAVIKGVASKGGIAVITTTLGRKPVNGGRPAKERMDIDNHKNRLGLILVRR